MIKDMIFKLVNTLLDTAYWACLSVSIVSLLMYVGGVKKAAKYTTISIVIYLIVQVVKMAI